MGWADGPMVGLDTETTGIDVFRDRIVTGTIITTDPVKGVVDHAEWIADPGVDIPEAAAAAVHGVTTERARAEGRDHDEVVGEMIALATSRCAELGAPLVIYNAPYDLSILHACAVAAGGTGWPTEADLPPIIDPLAMDKGMHLHHKRKRRLPEVSAVLRLEFKDAEAHASAYDTLMALRCAYKFARVYPAVIGDAPLVDLQEMQAGWHRAWAEDFEPYLRRVKREPDLVIEREWPIRYAPATAETPA